MWVVTTGERYRGALLGLAAADALGAAVEFEPPGSFDPLTAMIGGGLFGLEPGQWTDDASMALCLAESLVETGGFDPVDQLARFVDWWRHGHLSSTGKCFDIGVQTRTALAEFERTRSATPASPDPESCGNGSIMRLAPVPLFYAHDLNETVEMSGRSSVTTHPAPRCVDACRFLGALIAAAVNGASKEELLDPGFWRWGELHPEISEIARGSFLKREPPEIKGTGFVVRSLEAALWAFDRSDSSVTGRYSQSTSVTTRTRRAPCSGSSPARSTASTESRPSGARSSRVTVRSPSSLTVFLDPPNPDSPGSGLVPARQREKVGYEEPQRHECAAWATGPGAAASRAGS